MLGFLLGLAFVLSVRLRLLSALPWRQEAELQLMVMVITEEEEYQAWFIHSCKNVRLKISALKPLIR